MAKYKYDYRCPNCGTQLELKMRVTLTKRRCPQCGLPITPREIDRQAWENTALQAGGCLGCVGCLPLTCLWILTVSTILAAFQKVAENSITILIVLFAACVVYLVSFGPAYWLVSRTGKGVKVGRLIYFPIIWLQQRSPRSIGNLIAWYGNILAAPNWTITRR